MIHSDLRRVAGNSRRVLGLWCRNRRIRRCALAALGILLLAYVFTPRRQIPFDKERWDRDPYERYVMKDDVHRILRSRANWTPEEICALLPGVAPANISKKPGGGFYVYTKLGTGYLGKFIPITQHILGLHFDNTGKLVKFVY